MNARFASPLFSALLLAGTATAQSPDTAAGWAQLLLPSTTAGFVRLPMLHGGLRPLIGRTTSVVFSGTKDYTRAILYVGGTTSSGVSLQFGRYRILAYVPQPMFALPLPLQNGSAVLSSKIPNDKSLIGVDVPMQAVASGPKVPLAATNLLVGNLGTTSGWAMIAHKFKGQAPQQKRTNSGRIYSGDVVDIMSVPAFTSVQGGGMYLSLITAFDRPITRCVEVRTGRQGTGKLLGRICKQYETVNVKIPTGASAGSPIHVYLHNTDTNRGLGVTWSIAFF